MRELGFTQIKPQTCLSWSKRALELNCNEKLYKRSIKVLFEHDFRFFDKFFDKIIGENIPGYQYEMEEIAPGFRDDTIVKPEILATNFAFSPQNHAYLKVSQKFRSNKVGLEHSSAALLENAVGED